MVQVSSARCSVATRGFVDTARFRSRETTINSPSRVPSFKVASFMIKRSPHSDGAATTSRMRRVSQSGSAAGVGRCSHSPIWIELS